MAKQAKTIELELAEKKKSCGKYLDPSTRGQQYPRYFYLPKEWFKGEELPTKVWLSVEAS